MVNIKARENKNSLYFTWCILPTNLLPHQPIQRGAAVDSRKINLVATRIVTAVRP